MQGFQLETFVTEMFNMLPDNIKADNQKVFDEICKKSKLSISIRPEIRSITDRLVDQHKILIKGEV